MSSSVIMDNAGDSERTIFLVMADSLRSLNSVQETAYGAIGIPLAAIGLPIAVFLSPFYAEHMGLGLAVTGTIFMLLRFWDLFTDPIMGFLVDRFPAKRGRYKHWLVLSVIILAIPTFFLYMPEVRPVHPFYLAGWLMVFYVGSTLLMVPHKAWVSVLSPEYDERSRLFLYREIFSVAALILLLTLPIILMYFFNVRDDAQQLRIMGWSLVISLPLTVGIAIYFVPDPPPTANEPRVTLNFNDLKASFANRQLWRVAIFDVCIGTAVAATAATYLFVASHAFEVNRLIGMLGLVAYFLAGIVAMPFWTWLSRRTEKHIALRRLCIFNSLAFMIYLPAWLWVDNIISLFIAVFISGFGFGAPYILSRSMIADLIEIEEERSGHHRGGTFYAVMAAAYKAGGGLAIGVPYLLLGLLVGFKAEGGNSPEAILGLVLVFVGVPAVAYLIAAWSIWSYNVTRDKQAETAKNIANRKRDVAAFPAQG